MLLESTVPFAFRFAARGCSGCQPAGPSGNVQRLALAWSADGQGLPPSLLPGLTQFGPVTDGDE